MKSSIIRVVTKRERERETLCWKGRQISKAGMVAGEGILATDSGFSDFFNYGKAIVKDVSKSRLPIRQKISRYHRAGGKASVD